MARLDDLYRERADKVRRIAELDAKSAELRSTLHALSHGAKHQNEMLRAFKRLNIPHSFPEVEEDYYVHIDNFMEWTENQLDADFNEIAQHPADVTHNYTFLSTFEDAGLRILGISIGGGVALTYYMLDGKPCLSYVSDGDSNTIISDHEEARLLSDEVRADVGIIEALSIKLLRAYVLACTYVEVERKVSGSSVLSKVKFKNRKQPAPVVIRVIRAVKRIYVGPRGPAGPRSEPDHRVSVPGFWRRVDGVGRDAEGRPTEGRTWVRAHTRWNQKPVVEQKVVYIKERLPNG